MYIVHITHIHIKIYSFVLFFNANFANNNTRKAICKCASEAIVLKMIKITNRSVGNFAAILAVSHIAMGQEQNNRYSPASHC